MAIVLSKIPLLSYNAIYDTHVGNFQIRPCHLLQKIDCSHGIL